MKALRKFFIITILCGTIPIFGMYKAVLRQLYRDAEKANIYFASRFSPELVKTYRNFITQEKNKIHGSNDYLDLLNYLECYILSSYYIAMDHEDSQLTRQHIPQNQWEDKRQYHFKIYFPNGKNGTRLVIIQGDIIQEKDIQAIVAPIPQDLSYNKGAAGLIAQTAGAEFREKIATLDKTLFQQTKALPILPYDLKERGINAIILANNTFASQNTKNLRAIYLACLLTAKNNKIRNIAFPLIGNENGISMDEAASIALDTVVKYIRTHPEEFNEIRFILKKRDNFDIFNEEAEKIPTIGSDENAAIKNTFNTPV